MEGPGVDGVVGVALGEDHPLAIEPDYAVDHFSVPVDRIHESHHVPDLERLRHRSGEDDVAGVDHGAHAPAHNGAPLAVGGEGQGDDRQRHLHDCYLDVGHRCTQQTATAHFWAPVSRLL